jgi:hypothetical protein
MMHPKPKARKREPIKLFGAKEVLDLKTAEGRRTYTNRTVRMESRQGGLCALCSRPGYLTFDHECGRGMGGANRNDAIFDSEGNWINAALCVPCQGFKGSKRYHWQNGFYVPVPPKSGHYGDERKI